MTQEQALNDISVKVGRLEVMQENNTKAISEMATSVNRLVDKLEKSDDAARDALDKAKAAQHQINEIKDNQKWLWRTIVGAFLVAAAGFVISGGLN